MDNEFLVVLEVEQWVGPCRDEAEARDKAENLIEILMGQPDVISARLLSVEEEKING